MKFLVIEQDLRVSGTSQGIISRSFLSKLRTTYPEANIDVVYLKQDESDDQLELLPVNSIKVKVLNLKYPFFTKLVNRLYWRVFDVSLIDEFKHKQYANEIKKINYLEYEHIFVRSAGIDHEMILATNNLPILKRAIVNFHDPYPLTWYEGSFRSVSNLELFRLKKMMRVVSKAKTCSSSAHYMSHNLQYLYASNKFFYTLPHQFCENVFNLSDIDSVHKKTKKITISYQGAIQFGRDIDNLLLAYKELVLNDSWIRENTEFVLRLKSIEIYRIEKEYENISNIVPLHGLNFSNSYYEQKNIADINVILENGPVNCSILVGKAPMLAFIGKPVLTIAPRISEIRNIVKEEMYIATCGNKFEIKVKLENLILHIKNSKELPSVFGDYFSDENFKAQIEDMMYQNKSTINI
jgi:hypothetical protein